jgi:biotin carboxylase
LLPRIAVCFGSSGPHPLTIREAVADRYEIFWVIDSSVDDPGSLVRLMERAGSVVDIAGMEVGAATVELAAAQVAGITTFSDSCVLLTAQLADELGLRYYSVEIARALTDKGLQRSALAAHGIPLPGFWLIGADAGEAETAEVAATVRYPAVFKPRVAHGSRDAVVIAGAVELRSALDAVRAESRGFDAIVEEYLQDRQFTDPDFAPVFSLEVLVADGSVHHLISTGRFTFAEPLRETGSFSPSPVDDDDLQAAKSMADAAIRALGVTDGVLHIEQKLTPDGPRLIEINGRTGGGVAKQVQDISGFDLLRCSCDIAAGRFEPETLPAAIAGVSYQYFAQPPLGANRVEAIDGLDTIRGLDGVDEVFLKHAPGTVTNSRDGMDAMVYLVTGVTGSHEQLRSTVQTIERTGVIHSTRLPEP